jgi:hypothetical protein
MTRTILVLSPLLLAACDVDPDGNNANAGVLRMSVADAPVDGITAAFVTVAEVQVHRPAVADAPVDADADEPGDEGEDVAADGTWETVWRGTRTFDLLAYQDGRAAELVPGATLDAGDFDGVRLFPGAVPESGGAHPYAQYVLFAGQAVPFDIPSAEQSGLKVNGDFHLDAVGAVDLVVDWDVRRSLHSTGNGGFQMNPELRLIDATRAGSIVGQVDVEVPVDGWVEVSEDGVVKATGVIRPGPDDVGTYQVHYLPPGTYQVSVVGDVGPTDTREHVVVAAGGTTELDFGQE